MSSCPHCRKPQPRCAICLVNMGTPSCYDGPNPTSARSPSLTSLRLIEFSSWFTWCQTCRHGGHAAHMTQWFRWVYVSEKVKIYRQIRKIYVVKIMVNKLIQNWQIIYSGLKNFKMSALPINLLHDSLWQPTHPTHN